MQQAKTVVENPKLRERLPYAGFAIIAIVVGATLGSAGANMIPMKLPTYDEVQRVEQAETSADRKQTLAALVLAGDNCKPVVAAQIAKLLVFDGQSARAYTQDFAKRCGEIESVAKWGELTPPATQRTFRHFAAVR